MDKLTYYFLAIVFSFLICIALSIGRRERRPRPKKSRYQDRWDKMMEESRNSPTLHRCPLCNRPVGQDSNNRFVQRTGLTLYHCHQCNYSWSDYTANVAESSRKQD